MAEPISTTKAIIAVIEQLIKKDEKGDTGLKKILFAAGAVCLLVVFFAGIAAEIFLIPMNSIGEFLLPDSVVNFKQSIDDSFTRPYITSEQNGLLALPTVMRQSGSPYGWRTLNGKRNWHEGVDFPVGMYTEIGSMERGIVVDTGFNRSYGTFIIVKHQYRQRDPTTDDFIRSETFYILYAHLFSSYVFIGQEVQKNQGIALSGGDNKLHAAGNSTGAHLHIEIRSSPAYGSEMDPYEYVFKPLEDRERREYSF